MALAFTSDGLSRKIAIPGILRKRIIPGISRKRMIPGILWKRTILRILKTALLIYLSIFGISARITTVFSLCRSKSVKKH